MKCQVSPNVECAFKKRLDLVVQLIQKSTIEYHDIGVFGSYARGEYKATSDIDICVIADKKPDRYTSGELREEAELHNVDVVYVTQEYFQYSMEPFAIQIRKDYKSVL